MKVFLYRKLLCGYLIVLMTCFLPSCGSFLSSEISSPQEVQILIIDKSTSKPVSDVILIANWNLLGTSLAGGGSAAGSLALFEVISDENGMVRIPSWGPRKVNGGLRIPREPQIILFKKGYKYIEFLNSHMEISERSESKRIRLISEWNNKTIKLEPFIGNEKDYVNEVEYLSGVISYFSSFKCSHSKLKRTLNLIFDMKNNFNSKNIKNALPKIEKCKLAGDY